MGRSKIIIIAVAVLLVAAGAWYWGSPALAMSQLRDAAVEGDADALEERIDFASVREGLKEDFRAQFAAEMVNAEQEDGFSAFGSMIAMGMINPMVDGLINAESMAAMIQRGKLQADEAPAGEGEGTDWSIERDGFSRFRATPDAPEGEAVPSMVFERDGLGWKLVEIDMPEGGLGSVGA